jgi:hypothetical protein
MTVTTDLSWRNDHPRYFFKNDRDTSDLNVSTPASDSELGEEIEEPVEEIGNYEMSDSEACLDLPDSEEEDYGYNLGENSESESDSDLLDESGEELEEEDFGPEGDCASGRIDEDMVAHGYSEL